MGITVQQKRSLCTAKEHFDQLHAQAHGVVMVWEKLATSGAWTKLRPETQTANSAILASQKMGLDRYISVNEFYGWRCVRDLKSLRCFFVDIDGVYDFEWIISAVESAGLPSPTMAVFSGRGTHLYWLIDPVPASALPIWQQVQNEIVKRLAAAPESLNVDLVVKDCTRILRLVGSVNSKNNEIVRGLIIHPWRWTLHTLSDEILGFRDFSPKEKPVLFTAEDALALDVRREAASVRSFAAAQARKGTSNRAKTGSIYEWWNLVYRDLIRIGNANLLGIPDGHRDSWLFLYAVSLSWFAEPETLADEVFAVAKSYTQGLKKSEINSVIAPILTRSEAARAGEKIEWDGQLRDPRMYFKRSTILARMKPIIPDDLYPDLRAIIPDDLRQERRQECENARWTDKNTGQGYRLSDEQRRATARLMRASGSSVRSIAKEMGISVGTAQNWTR